MMANELFKQFQKFVIDNSPGILTGIGVTGTLTTAFLTGRGAFRAADILLDDARLRSFYTDSKPQTVKEQFALTWRCYIPAVGVGTMTVTCIIAANRIGTRRAAALATAYTLSEKAFVEYREKIVEKLGENKEREARDEIAQDKVMRTTNQIIVSGEGLVLCHDAYTERFFEGTMEGIKKAQNDCNYTILNDSYCSLGEFYGKLGLKPPPFGEEVGWNTDTQLDILFSTVLTDDGRPCLSINFRVEPIRGYRRFH